MVGSRLMLVGLVLSAGCASDSPESARDCEAAVRSFVDAHRLALNARDAELIPTFYVADGRSRVIMVPPPSRFVACTVPPCA